MHRVYLSPGLFGFGKLGSYDYFMHLRAAMLSRFRDAGEDVRFFVVDAPPTGSIRRRAMHLLDVVSQTNGDDDGPIHLVGHSTGGLDARLVASPSARLEQAGALGWGSRLRTVTTLNAPHYGTPLASFFATAKGQKMLFAVSALTYVALSVGAPPLALASALVVGIGRLDRAVGLELRAIDGLTDRLLGVIDDARDAEVRKFFEALKEDQGGIIQLTPEAMDLFQAGVEDRPGVRYQCVATMAPPSHPVDFTASIASPWGAVSTSLFTMLQGLTARYDERYPCAAANAGEQAEAMLAKAFDRAPGARANDGVVPLRSQIWGELIWTGYADHLDVLGHFSGTDDGGKLAHVDWMTSGSSFGRSQFVELSGRIVKGMLESG